MKKIVAGICYIVLTITQLQAQKKSILLEPQSRKINQGDPLPLQSSFDLQVPVGKETGIIQINIFRGNKPSDVIQHTYWVRPLNFSGDFAELPVDVKFRSGNKYGFDVTLYALLTDTERISLKEIVHRNLSNYLNASIEAGSKSIDLEKTTGTTMQDLNAIMKKSLTWYKNTRQREFEGFSDIVLLKLKQVSNARLSNAHFNVVRSNADSLLTNDQLKAVYASRLQTDLLQIILNEADNYLDLDFVKLYDSFIIPNRVTERSQTVLPIFVGYGGVYLGGSFNNLEYNSQPYAGLSFPLGRGTESHYGRTSFILGLFLANFKDGGGNTITGPIVDRPVFAGLGFRIYDFINFNAGMVATSTDKETISSIKTQDVQLKPFIGVNAQFNLWLGLNKK